MKGMKGEREPDFDSRFGGDRSHCVQVLQLWHLQIVCFRVFASLILLTGEDRF